MTSEPRTQWLCEIRGFLGKWTLETNQGWHRGSSWSCFLSGLTKIFSGWFHIRIDPCEIFSGKNIPVKYLLAKNIFWLISYLDWSLWRCDTTNSGHIGIGEFQELCQEFGIEEVTVVLIFNANSGVHSKRFCTCTKLTHPKFQTVFSSFEKKFDIKHWEGVKLSHDQAMAGMLFTPDKKVFHLGQKSEQVNLLCVMKFSTVVERWTS